MADNIFTRLGGLFQSNIVVRKTKDNRIVVKDIDYSQLSLTSNFIDRYNKLFNSRQTPYTNAQNARALYNVAKTDLYRDYELMDQDPIISSALDVYSDESTVNNIENMTLGIETENDKIYNVLHNLFYDILNVEYNLWSWIRNMVKYGDFFLSLDIVDKLGIVNVRPLSSYDVLRLENHNPDQPNLVEFEVEGDVKNLKQNYEIAHFRMLSDTNFLPYGKSMLEGGRKVFKQLTLMEDAMLIHRIMRAPEKRIFKIDIGNIPPNEVENFMNRIINKMKKIPVIDQDTGEYNLKYNIESVTEDYFLPVRGGDSGTQIDTLQGLTNEGAIDDIEYLKNKLFASLRIPKAFLGYEEGIGSKATLAAEDVRFARTIERIQKIAIAELEKIAIVHLYTQGFEDAELLNFDLKLQNPSMIHEQEKLELMRQQLEIAKDSMDSQLFSRAWIYDNIFNINNADKAEIFDQIIEDQKQTYRMESISSEGTDPADPANQERKLEIDKKGQWGGSRPGPFKKEIDRGQPSVEDLNPDDDEKQGFGKREFKGKSPLAQSKGSTLVKKESFLKSLQKKYQSNFKNAHILSEDAIINEDK